MDINHDVKLQIQSSSSNCVQTATSQLVSFFHKQLTPETIEQSIPIRRTEDGKPLGTLLPDIGRYLMTQGFLATVHVFDIQIIDRSWTGMSQAEILNELKVLQKTGISTAKTPYTVPLINSYINFLLRLQLISV